MNRRRFTRYTALSAIAPFFNSLSPLALEDENVTRITILHTNDVHSRIDPFPMDGSRNEGQGGVAKRAVLIEQIRDRSDHVLLLDAGDIFQGTPYFNMFGGELELKLMTSLRYDAATMGNHDFDAGLDGFEKQLIHADFPFIISNYDFKDTVLNGRTSTNRVFEMDDIRLGIYGLGIELEGLVPQSLYGQTQYRDPIGAAKNYELFLKRELGCDYVICLSHLGYRYRDQQVSDVVLASETYHTDLIIGGHTHTFMREPHIELNKAGNPVLINQVGFAGILLGKIDLYFEKSRKRRKYLSGDNMLVGQ